MDERVCDCEHLPVLLDLSTSLANFWSRASISIIGLCMDSSTLYKFCSQYITVLDFHVLFLKCDVHPNLVMVSLPNTFQS